MWLSFMVHLCKMIISSGFFFHFRKILIFWVVRGVKGQKKVQNEKTFCPSCSISYEPYIIWLSFMETMCEMYIFMFSKLWISRSIAGGIKGQKSVQNDKTLCLPHSISQEPYIIWLPFRLHMCKMIISTGIIFMFSKFWFSGSIAGRVKWQKSVGNDKKLCLPHSISLENDFSAYK